MTKIVILGVTWAVFPGLEGESGPQNVRFDRSGVGNAKLMGSGVGNVVLTVL